MSYIGQDLYTDLNDLTLDTLKAHLDTAVELMDDRAFLTEAVERLRRVERRNRDTAGALLGLEGGGEE